ncbi:unnamed protein product, partial [Iphiclides podalirius]
MVNYARNVRSRKKGAYAGGVESKINIFGGKWVEFCKRTDLHGFKYIVMEELNDVERGCWALAVGLSVICAAYFIIVAYRWYARNPIVTLSPIKSCSDILERCMWKNVMYHCELLFKPIFTVFNICCTFNYYAVEEREYDHKSNITHSYQPRHVASCGHQTALRVLLRTKQDDSYSTSMASTGSLVLIDNANNIPDMNSPFRLINPSTELLVAMSPERTYTTQGVKSFTTKERQCYYHDEVKIGDFRQYSFHNCIAYQNIDVIQKSCNCVPYYFPMRNRDLSHVCNFRDMECLEEVLKPKEVEQMPNSFSEENVQCLPECEHYDYPLETAQGNLATGLTFNGLSFTANVNLYNHSVLNVFFNDLVSTRYRRDVYLNWQNVLAAFGGLLSLMIGFTLISGFDFALFLTFRVFCDSVKWKLSCAGERSKEKRKLSKSSVIQVADYKTAAIRSNMKDDVVKRRSIYQNPIKY